MLSCAAGGKKVLAVLSAPSAPFVARLRRRSVMCVAHRLFERRVPSFLAVLLICGASSTALAQDFRGAITGRVVDASGARLPGATVTATNVETNVTTSTTTTADGDFSILYLTPGKYSLTVEMSGFKKVVREGIEVRVADRLTVDFSME